LFGSLLLAFSILSKWKISRVIASWAGYLHIQIFFQLRLVCMMPVFR
jgi:hypothetical protein